MTGLGALRAVGTDVAVEEALGAGAAVVGEGVVDVAADSTEAVGEAADEGVGGRVVDPPLPT